jgi:hypothetical protein
MPFIPLNYIAEILLLGEYEFRPLPSTSVLGDREKGTCFSGGDFEFNVCTLERSPPIRKYPTVLHYTFVTTFLDNVPHVYNQRDFRTNSIASCQLPPCV